MQRTVDELIDVSHRHLVLTIPGELREVLFRHHSLLKVMMDCSGQTALEVLQSQKSEAGEKADRTPSAPVRPQTNQTP